MPEKHVVRVRTWKKSKVKKHLIWIENQFVEREFMKYEIWNKNSVFRKKLNRKEI